MKLVQNRDGVGPYGAKGGGEGAVNPIGPCMANALYRATGARVRSAAADARARVEGRARRAAIGSPRRRGRLGT